mmetsp:Transcript_867/g.1357  ORF Transcript_867/g.1357 Transcript_867/m.1357 type:complete len:154 (+) Transcript_867:24-485(+)
MNRMIKSSSWCQKLWKGYTKNMINQHQLRNYGIDELYEGKTKKEWIKERMGHMHHPVATPEQVAKHIVELVQTHENCKYPEKVTVESSLKEVGMDSLDQADIVWMLEEEFWFKIDDDEAFELDTIPKMTTHCMEAVTAKLHAALPFDEAPHAH